MPYQYFAGDKRRLYTKRSGSNIAAIDITNRNFKYYFLEIDYFSNEL